MMKRRNIALFLSIGMIVILCVVAMCGCIVEPNTDSDLPEPKEEGPSNNASGEIVIPNKPTTISYSAIKVDFNSCGQLKEFLSVCNAVNDGFRYLNLDKLGSIPLWERVRLCYDAIEEGKLVNPTITIRSDVYDEDLGYRTGEKVTQADLLDGDVMSSYSMEIIARPLTNATGEITFSQYKHSFSPYMWNHIVCVYSGEELLAEIYYYTGLNIDLEYFKQLFVVR